MRAAWIAVRAVANAPLTVVALGGAMGLGARVRLGPGLLWVCTGVRAMDSINRGGMTFGNVYILGDEFAPSKLEPESLKHESRHVDQWAVAALLTWPRLLPGQAVMAALYLGIHGAFGPFGNPFEILAGLEAGGYGRSERPAGPDANAGPLRREKKGRGAWSPISLGGGRARGWR